MSNEQNTSYEIGRDHQFECEILNTAQTAAVDISTWALAWMVKRYTSDADVAALVSKTTGAGIAVTGSFDADPEDNTQLAVVTIEDSDTTSLNPGLYFHELKRTDAGFETTLIYGTIEFIERPIR